MIKNDCWVSINLNELVATRLKFLNESEYNNIELSSDDIDECANELRIRMTFDSIFEQVDYMIYEIADEINPNAPHYGEIQPEPGREAYLNEIEKNKKQFEMVDLVSPSWTIKVPRRKNK